MSGAGQPTAPGQARDGVLFVVVEHDEWCPGAHGRPLACICNAQPKLVSENRFAAAVAATAARLNRQQRRAAARAARRGGAR